MWYSRRRAHRLFFSCARIPINLILNYFGVPSHRHAKRGIKRYRLNAILLFEWLHLCKDMRKNETTIKARYYTLTQVIFPRPENCKFSSRVDPFDRRGKCVYTEILQKYISKISRKHARAFRGRVNPIKILRFNAQMEGKIIESF